LTKITATLGEDLCKFSVIPRSDFLGMRNILDKFVEEIKTYFLFNIYSPPKKIRALCENMWKSMVELDSPQMTI
jgi:hypothetical protein